MEKDSDDMQSIVDLPGDMITVQSARYTVAASFERSKHRVSDVLIAAVLCVPASIVSGVLWLLHRFTVHDGGTFFYRGTRLGKQKRPFTIYKIRTMVADAESTVGASLFSGDAALLLWYGGFLRATKLDELPQILNILRGEMSFIGPRPVRPVLYTTHLRRLPDYDRRFAVRPGLTGYSQFLTPYGTSKSIRSRIDNLFIKNRNSLLDEFLFVSWTAMQLGYSLLRETWLCARDRAQIPRRSIGRGNQRKYRRIRPNNIEDFWLQTGNIVFQCHVVDINQEAMLITSQERFHPQDGATLTLRVNNIRGNPRKLRRIECFPTTCVERGTHSGTSGATTRQRQFVVHYEPKSEYHRYLMEKYVLRTTMAGV